MKKIVMLITITACFFLSGCDFVPEDEPEDQVTTIEEVLTSEVGYVYQIEGIVITNVDDGILLKDSTGYIYVHIDKEHNYAIGNTLSIKGSTENIGGTIQFSSASEITPISIDTFDETRTPTMLTEEKIKEKLTSYTTGEYIKVNGTCKEDGSNNLLSFNDEDTMISVINTKGVDWTCPVDTNVMLTGYILNTTSNNTLNVIYASHINVEVSFDDIDTQMIGLDEYTIIDWTTYISNPISNVSSTFTYDMEDLVDYSTPGAYEVTLTVMDEYDNEATQTFEVVVMDPNILVQNGDFSYGDAIWSFNNGSVEGGDGTFSVNNGVAKITVITPVESGWAPRLESNVMTFEHGETYTITFEVKADNERTIGVQIGKLLPDAPWFDDYLGYSVLIDIDQNWQTIEFNFEMYDPTGEGQLLFNMGKITKYSNLTNYNTTVYFDNIEIVKHDASMNPPELYGVFDVMALTGTDFDPLRWVSAYDSEDGDLTEQIELIGDYDLDTPGEYTLTYKVTDSDGNKAEETLTLYVEQKYTVAEVLEGEIGAQYKVLATIVAVKANGLLITDESNAMIYLYTGYDHGGLVGDKLYVDGVTSTYGGAVQFDMASFYSIYEAGEYTDDRTAVVYDGAGIEILRYDFAPGALIQFTGTLQISGDYTNVIIDGTTASGSLYPYSDDMDFSVYEGQVVTVTGYLLYFNGDEGQYMNVIATTITTD